ncbi:hypothetical protein [Sphaerochaeta halotolerans]|uniref:hypothetical protein n=1 Tax=Sphaerochaeta halotolerans TaxID=2293840 RepID=UPI00136E7690|nr:hypothetical protein [Sphaerochaeta halotolerans]MXI86764.1 hypothetical protein [Sphaerochaeta halotolerans]
MKKTIAILLVLVIGMAGVFAADDASLKLTTSVGTLTEFKITQEAIGTSDTHDYSKFTALGVRNTSEVSRNSGIADAAYITVANNSTTDYSIGVKASKLAADGIGTTIGYNVTVGTVTVAALEPLAASTSTTYTEVIKVVGTAENGLTIASEQITASIITNEYDSAAAGSYEGFIYFNVTAE